MTTNRTVLLAIALTGTVGVGAGAALMLGTGDSRTSILSRPAAPVPALSTPTGLHSPDSPLTLTVTDGTLVSVAAVEDSTAQPVAPNGTPSTTPTGTTTTSTPTPSPAAANADKDSRASAAPRDTSYDGTILTGTLSGDKRTWTSTGTLVPGTGYALTVTVKDNDGAVSTRTVGARTSDASAVATSSMSPLAGETVGVGMPVAIRISTAATTQQDKAAVEKALTVAVNGQPAQGAWHWFGGKELHYRQKDYWPAHATITVTENLRGVKVGQSHFLRTRTVSYKTGAKHVTIADLATYKMTVSSDDQVVRVIPFSGGRPKYPTNGGIDIVLDKDASRIMDSSTVGIGGSEAYRTKVQWATRLTNSGTFVHAAPWSVASQGRRHVSHGCLNVSTSNGKFFYDFSRRGDIVEVRNAKIGPKKYDAGAMDWNLTWTEWLKGSALPQQQQQQEAVEAATPTTAPTPGAGSAAPTPAGAATRPASPAATTDRPSASSAASASSRAATAPAPRSTGTPRTRAAR